MIVGKTGRLPAVERLTDLLRKTRSQHCIQQRTANANAGAPRASVGAFASELLERFRSTKPTAIMLKVAV